MNNGKLVGFVDFGGRQGDSMDLATHICGEYMCILSSCFCGYCSFVCIVLVIYIRSVCGSLSMPLSWWPTKGIKSYQLVSIFWEAVCVCEIHDVFVVAVVADGAAANKRFFDTIHGSKFTLTDSYTAPNPGNPARVIYICVDTSHLLKVIIFV